MKKFNTEITIDAMAAQLQQIGITIPNYCGQAIRAWDFNTMTATGPCAKVYPYYSEDDYYEIPMRYIRFVDLTIEEASLIYPDAVEAYITMVPGLSVENHLHRLERTYLLSGQAKAVYYEVSGFQLRTILSQQAHRYRLIENFVQELQAMNLQPVCEDEGIRLEYTFNDSLQPWVSKLLNTYIGFWRSIAIKVTHDRENRIARYYIKYQLITGRDLTDDQLIAAVEHVQKRIG